MVGRPQQTVAKVATRTVKPTGEYIVQAGEESDFLHPLSVHLIPGIELRDIRRLKEFNLTLAGHVAALTLAQLELIFGRRSQNLLDAVQGFDPSPVLPAGKQPPEIRVDHAFGNDTNNRGWIKGVLYRLVETAGTDLRRRRLAARRIAVVLDYCDGLRTARQAVLRPATANDVALFTGAVTALERAWKRRVRIRHLRVVCDRLTFPPAQRELFGESETARQTADNLTAAIDAVRQRFGTDAVRVGRTLT